MIHRECGVLKTTYEVDMALYPLPIARWAVGAVAVVFFGIVPLGLGDYYLSVANLVWIAVIGATGHSALYERMIGSRADRIVQLAHCPVLVVK